MDIESKSPSAYKNCSPQMGKTSLPLKFHSEPCEKDVEMHFAHGYSTKLHPSQNQFVPEPLPQNSYMRVCVMCNFFLEDLNKSCIWALIIQEAQVVSDVSKKGALPRADKEPFINQIRQGSLVHNDMNPRNMLFDEDGRLVIVDFDI
ncbi:hypothetical protein EDD18DRAFT_1111691 [Armillaria luteobubalina]|uniref:Protein kinase domain-containing protein n=1 Tax=Armillaria luteobubalina TaxID=153913 RepID=A0AA39PI52_9AGAR|nr:hypothetical protein EDD18DRAFT_1111691 [Armillaria luteobubalina]